MSDCVTQRRRGGGPQADNPKGDYPVRRGEVETCLGGKKEEREKE